MNDDLFSDPEDQFEIEPADFEDAFAEVMISTLSKRLVAAAGAQWTDSQENDLQGRISNLLAAAKTRGLSTLTMTVVRKATGERIRRESTSKGLGGSARCNSFVQRGLGPWMGPRAPR